MEIHTNWNEDGLCGSVLSVKISEEEEEEEEEDEKRESRRNEPSKSDYVIATKRDTEYFRLVCFRVKTIKSSSKIGT
jgi:hypothetical protein